MYLNGIILISSILNFQTAEFDTGNDLPYILYLPTYTAIAWYHKKLPADLQSGGLQKALDESRNFAAHEYTDALMSGDNLPAARRTDIAQKLSRLTGLPTDYLMRSNLRIEIQRFDKELLRDQRRTVGRLDGRFIGIDEDAAGSRPDYDPSLAAIVGPYTATFHDYVRGDYEPRSVDRLAAIQRNLPQRQRAANRNRRPDRNGAQPLHFAAPLGAAMLVCMNCARSFFNFIRDGMCTYIMCPAS